MSRSSKSETKSPKPDCSPNISVGPPQSPPNNPYSNLFSSGLYQQYLGQLLASQATGPGHAPPALNPMLLQAQLAMAAQTNLHNNPLLASYSNHANMISERLKQNRFSPYSSPPASQHSPLNSGLASAFKALGGGVPGSKLSPDEAPNSPPVSPPHSTSPPPSLPSLPSNTSNVSPNSGSVKSEPDQSSSSPRLRSDIKNIENMINGLNGTSEGRFSLSHATQSAAEARIS